MELRNRLADRYSIAFTPTEDFRDNILSLFRAARHLSEYRQCRFEDVDHRQIVSHDSPAKN